MNVTQEDRVSKAAFRSSFAQLAKGFLGVSSTHTFPKLSFKKRVRLHLGKAVSISGLGGRA